jgi:alkylation response protein AidB-like acyl-CoA dehydrogenase
MDLDLSDEHRIFQDELRGFLEAEIAPLDARWGDEEMTAPRARDLQRRLVPFGYLGGSGPAPRRSRS